MRTNREGASVREKIGSVALGALAGGLVAVVVSRCSAEAPREGGAQPATARRSAPNEGAASIRDGPVAAASAAHCAVADMELRLRALERERGEGSPDRRADRRPAVSPEEHQAQREERRQARRERHRQSIERHRAEPVDPDWAPAASEALRAGLEAESARAGYAVVAADCRTTSCVGDLEWPSYGAAVAGYGAVLHHVYPAVVNCQSEILLPRPADEQAPYRASLVLDCTEQFDRVRSGEQ